MMVVNINEKTLVSKTPHVYKYWYIDPNIQFYQLVDSDDNSEKEDSKYKCVCLFCSRILKILSIGWIKHKHMIWLGTLLYTRKK